MSQTKKLPIAVIGAGHWGPNLIRNFHTQLQSEVLWVVDLDAARLKLIADKYPTVPTTSDWHRAISDPRVEAVVVCTPTATHAAVAEEALRQGKHVFVEKPLAATSQEARHLVQLARDKQLKLMVGHIFLFNPAVRKIKELIEAGELGEILYLYSIRTNLGPIRGDVSALWDLGAHDVSIFMHLLGSKPEVVSGYGSALINPPIEDVVFAGLRFDGKVIANLHVSWLDPKKVRQLVVVGSKKMLVFDDMQATEPVKVFDKNVGVSKSSTNLNDTIQSFRKSIFEGSATVPIIASEEPLLNECRAFVEWVQGGPAPLSDGSFGAEVVEVLETITRQISVTT